MRISFLTFNPAIINIYKPKQFKATAQANNLLYSPSKDVFIKNEPIAFKSNASTKNFEIKNIKNMHCPVCGKLMLSEQQIRDFVKDVAPKKGDKLVEALEKYEDEGVFTGVESKDNKSIYRPQKQEIVNIIKKLAKENPNKSLEELVQQEAGNRLQGLIYLQLAVVRELEEYIEANVASRKEKNNLNNIIKEHKKRITGESKDDFQRKPFILALSDEIVSDKNVQQKIIDIALKLPSSDTEIGSFFVKYGRRSSKEIASKLVAQSIATAEHMVPRSKQGANQIKNYLCDCAECNAKRGNISFFEWQKTIPDFKEKLIRHFKEIIKAQNEDLLGVEYETYVDDLAETIKNLSQGEITFEDSEIRDENYKKDKIYTRKKRIVEINKKVAKLKKQLSSVREKIKEIEALPNYSIIATHQLKSKEIEEAKKAYEESNLPKKEKTRLYDKLRMWEYQKRIYEREILKPEENINFVREKSKALLEKMRTIKNLNDKSATLEGIRTEKEKNEDMVAMLQEENRILLLENKSIEALPDFNPKDESRWIEYQIKQKRLQDIIKAIRSNKSQFGNLIKAKVKIENKIRDLDTLNSVKYFKNKERIKTNEQKINKLSNKISIAKGDISTNENKLYDTAFAFHNATNGTTYEEIKAEYDAFIEHLKYLEKILNIDELKSEAKKLQRNIAFYMAYLQKLKNFATMSDEEFNKYIMLANKGPA